MDKVIHFEIPADNLAGGKTVLSKQKVSDMGFYAKLSATEGNVIGL